MEYRRKKTCLSWAKTYGEADAISSLLQPPLLRELLGIRAHERAKETWERYLHAFDVELHHQTRSCESEWVTLFVGAYADAYVTGGGMIEETGWGPQYKDIDALLAALKDGQEQGEKLFVIWQTLYGKQDRIFIFAKRAEGNVLLLSEDAIDIVIRLLESLYGIIEQPSPSRGSRHG